MTTRRVTTHEVSAKDEPLARVHLVATLVDPVHLLPLRNYFQGKSIQPDERATAVSDEDGMIVVELVRNDVMSEDSRYLIETWIEREDKTRTPRRRQVIFLRAGTGDVSLDDLDPSAPITPPQGYTRYIAIRDDANFTASDFAGPDSNSATDGLLTMPTFSGVRKFNAILVDHEEGVLNSVHIYPQGGMASPFNENINTYDESAVTITIANRIYGMWITVDSQSDIGSGAVVDTGVA